MGEDWYQESLARLRSGAKPGQAQAATPAGGRTPWQLQNRQVALVDAYGNVTITGDNDTVNLSPDEAPAYLVNMYYAALADECQRLPLGVIDQEFTKPGLPGELSLKNVYTDLDVVSPPPEEEEGKASRWTMLRLAPGTGEGRQALLQAISEPRRGGWSYWGCPARARPPSWIM